MIVRPLRAAALDQVVRLAGALPEAPRWSHQCYLDALDPEVAPRRISLAIEAEAGCFAGFLVARLVGPEAELEIIAIDPELQRRGLGRTLLASLLARLTELSADALLLEVRASNAPARALYRSAGFLETGLRRRYYVDPIEDAVLMTLSLPA